MFGASMKSQTGDKRRWKSSKTTGTCDRAGPLIHVAIINLLHIICFSGNSAQCKSLRPRINMSPQNHEC